uniref:Uncharacterized protein n=1 Tax=viral metagenome TaxID=1070528 RepID=A0A6M3L103_9ZZZZ
MSADLREAALRVIRAVDANRDAINGLGHPGEDHDRMLHVAHGGEYDIFSPSLDCAACDGAEYGTGDEMDGAVGDLRAALGMERKPWEYER